MGAGKRDPWKTEGTIYKVDILLSIHAAIFHLRPR